MGIKRTPLRPEGRITLASLLSKQEYLRQRQVGGQHLRPTRSQAVLQLQRMQR